MKHNWTYKKLGEVVKCYRGLTYSKADEVPVSSKMVLRSNNIDLDTHALNFDEIKCVREDLPIADDRKLKKDSIFICMSNGSMQHLGKVAYVDKDYDYAFGGFMGLIVPNPQEVFPKYVYYSLLAPNFLATILREGRGANINNLRFTDLENYSLPMPAKDEQQAIVSELDGINRLIDLQEEQLREYDRLAQSLFYTTFGDPVSNPKGWEVKLIGEIGNVERGAGISKKDFVPSGSPCIHYGQLHTVFGPYTTRHISCIPNDLIAKPRIAHPNDVVMAITSEDVEGSCKSTAWMGDYDVIVGSDAAILHHSQNGVYVSYYTQTKAFYIEKEKYANGFKVTHISAKDIESIPIMCPPLALQQSFAAQIEAIEQQKALIRRSLDETRTLLAARMQYYFE